MLHALSAEVAIAGVVGDDVDGLQLRHELDRLGIAVDNVISDPSRPTTVKERFLGRAANRHPHQMLRVDSEVRDPIAARLEEQLFRGIEGQLCRCDILLVSDYGKGVCRPELLGRLFESAKRQGVPVLVDPLRGHDYTAYRGATAITPNRLEAELASGGKIRTPSDAVPLGRQLCQSLDLEAIIITLDCDGATLVMKEGDHSLFPTVARQVYDITGAGDMVLSVIGMCLAAGTSYADAIRLANVAGGLEVEKIGVAVLTRDEIVAELEGRSGALPSEEPASRREISSTSQRVLSLEALVRSIAVRRNKGERIALTNGCFDLLHVGHATYLEEAARHGDCLIVALNSDASVQRLKGPSRPVIPEADRARMLAALASVDYVVVFDEDTPHELLRHLRPNVLIKGGTYTPEEVVGREVVEAYGGEVCVVGLVEGVSTSRLIETVGRRTGQPAAPHFLQKPVGRRDSSEGGVIAAPSSGNASDDDEWKAR